MMATPQQKFRLTIGKGYTAEQKQKITKAVIKTIESRTKKGNDLRGGKFVKYTKEYKTFKTKHLGSASPVNLRLSTQMLSDLKGLPPSSSTSITVGYDKGTESNDKAHGNQSGSYGKPYPRANKKRKFLGITPAEKKIILGKFKPANLKERLKEADKIQSELEASL